MQVGNHDGATTESLPCLDSIQLADRSMISSDWNTDEHEAKLIPAPGCSDDGGGGVMTSWAWRMMVEFRHQYKKPTKPKEGHRF